MSAPGSLGTAGRRVLVTGASGFIGSYMAARFVRDGARVWGLSRTIGRAASLTRLGSFEFVECDLEDGALCRRLVGALAPEVVLHFASRADGAESAAHARASVAANIGATVNLLEACAPGVRVLVYGDSCKVHGTKPPPYHEGTPVEPNSSYSATKAAGWWICRVFAASGSFAAVSFRPTLIYGPGQGINVIGHVAASALSGVGEIVLDGGSQTRDPLYIDDAVEACVRLVDRAPSLSGRSIALGGGAEISVEELARRVVEACGSSAAVRACPERARATEIWRSWCDNRDARRLLDWSPEVTLAEGLTRTITSIRERQMVDLTNTRGPEGIK